MDPSPRFVALVNDPAITKHRVQLEVGQVKNVNNNPLAEHAIKELGIELLQLFPEGGPTSKVTLALATGYLNSRIRRDGLSASEFWTKRGQLTAEQLSITDRQLILNQNSIRAENHVLSAKSKANGHGLPPANNISFGDLVYLKGDRDKCRARDRYIVIQLTNGEGWCQLRKFTKSQFRNIFEYPIVTK